ncbi:MAG: hypothetical protein EOM91_02115 [Sphingobacteriia bacterium]|nr:hypothetical protein [Sphingobacteriia bacterium]NCC38512.1 hypothetical protein [Gammaproteobacteria bacterium]
MTAVTPTWSAAETSVFDYETAKDLLAVCTSEQDAAVLACRAFLEATVQYHDAVSDGRRMKRLVCYPGGLTVEQARATFVAWGEQHADNAERMSELPVVAVVRSLAAAHPCR